MIAASLPRRLALRAGRRWRITRSAAEFDSNKPVQLKGTVVKVEWINPHTWIHIDVKQPDGSVERWMIEGGTPNTLLRRGLTQGVAARRHRSRRGRLPREERHAIARTVVT